MHGSELRGLDIDLSVVLVLSMGSRAVCDIDVCFWIWVACGGDFRSADYRMQLIYGSAESTGKTATGDCFFATRQAALPALPALPAFRCSFAARATCALASVTHAPWP